MTATSVVQRMGMIVGDAALNTFKVICSAFAETGEELGIDPWIEAWVSNKVKDLGGSEFYQIFLSCFAESGRETFLSSPVDIMREGLSSRTQMQMLEDLQTTQQDQRIESTQEIKQGLSETTKEVLQTSLSTVAMFAGALTGGFLGSLGTAIGSGLIVMGGMVDEIVDVKKFFKDVLESRHQRQKISAEINSIVSSLARDQFIENLRLNTFNDKAKATPSKDMVQELISLAETHPQEATEHWFDKLWSSTSNLPKAHASFTGFLIPILTAVVSGLTWMAKKGKAKVSDLRTRSQKIEGIHQLVDEQVREYMLTRKRKYDLGQIAERVGFIRETVAKHIKTYLEKKINFKVSYDILFGVRVTSYSDLEVFAAEQGWELVTTSEQWDKMVEEAFHGLTNIRVKWKCGHDHTFSRAISFFRQHPDKVRCPDCTFIDAQFSDFTGLATNLGIRFKLNKLQFEELVFKAREKGVQVKSLKTKWWCGKRDHDPFEASYYEVQRGTGCKHCTLSNFQRLGTWYARKVFSDRGKVEVRVSKIVPSQARRVGTARVDLYFHLSIRGEGIEVVLEFNGYQHYKFPNRYHVDDNGNPDYQKYQAQRIRDDMVREVLPRNGIIFIEVPYTLKYSQFQSHMVREFKKQATNLGLKARLAIHGRLNHKFIGSYDLKLDY